MPPRPAAATFASPALSVLRAKSSEPSRPSATPRTSPRLEGQAPVGSVLIEERTRELLGEVAEVEPVGELRVKGKERPVRAFVLQSVREGGSG
ncbi:MAG TPA: hypothetical protein VE737_10030 [Actinomycetota bacterium]|nr:hypothetical protein [Actinomycetota bacterium]